MPSPDILHFHSTPSEKKNLIVKNSRNGKGIFARHSFKVEKIIFEVKGKLITCDEDDEIDEETRSNTYRYDEDLFLSPKGRIGGFLNHSCSPNAKVVKKGKKLLIVSIKNISKDEEVLIDYSTIIADDDSWKMKCNCESLNCRLVIKKFSTLPTRTKNAYLKAGIVPEYIFC